MSSDAVRIIIPLLRLVTVVRSSSRPLKSVENTVKIGTRVVILKLDKVDWAGPFRPEISALLGRAITAGIAAGPDSPA